MAKAYRQIQTGTLHRSFELKRDGINDEKRTVELAFSSETPVERYFGTEVLDHNASSVDLSRLNKGGALLVDHSTRDQIGVVENARIDSDKIGRATVRFGKSARANEIFQDVKDGIRSLVSVGYRINKMVTETDDKDVETLRATSWTPLEISLVSIPADASVGIGRAEEKTFTTQIELKPMRILHSPEGADGGTAAVTTPPAQAVNVTEIRADAAKANNLRCKEINAIADKAVARCPEVATMARAAVENGDSVEAFRTAAFEKLSGAKPLAVSSVEVLTDARDLKKYSLSRAILAAAKGDTSGFEFDVSQDIAKLRGKEAKGFYIPTEILQQRALSVNTATAGGFLVGTELKSGELIELLRNRTVVENMGCRRMAGLVGNVAIPKIAGAATAYWLPETGTVTESDQSFGQLVLTPHRLVVDTAFSKELLAQNAVSTEAIVRDDINRVSNIALDLAALAGTGNAGQPLGVLNTPNLSTAVTFSAAATWAKILTFETNVATNNADLGSIGWIVSPGTRGKWKNITKVASSQYSNFLWDNGENGEGQVNGYRALVTNQVPSNKVFYGNWNDLILASWAGIDVVVDPYSLKKSGQIEITMTQWADVGVRHPVSFCVSTDSGAQ